MPLAHWSLFRCKLFWAYDNPLKRKKWEWPYVTYPVAAWLIRSGTVSLRYRSGIETYHAGTWVFPKEEEAVQLFSEDVHLLSIRFQAEWCYGVPIFDRSKSVAIPQEDAVQLTNDGERLVGFIRRHFPEAKASNFIPRGDFALYLELQPLLMLWMASYYAALSERGVSTNSLEALDTKVLATLHAIETHPLSTPLQGSDLAEEVACSVSQLNKLFAKQIGTTPAVLWNRRKLAAAKSELLNSSESIKVIAFNVGFSSTEHFSNWFKKSTGFSPRAYRLRHPNGSYEAL